MRLALAGMAFLAVSAASAQEGNGASAQAVAAYEDLGAWAESHALHDGSALCRAAIERLGGEPGEWRTTDCASPRAWDEFKQRWDALVDAEAAAHAAVGDVEQARAADPDLPAAREAGGEVFVPPLGWLGPEDAARWGSGLRPDGMEWLDAAALRARGRSRSWPAVWSVHGESFRVRTDAAHGTALELLGEAESLRRTWTRLARGVADLSFLEGLADPAVGPDRMEVRYYLRRGDFAADARAVSPGSEGGPGFFCSGDMVSRFVRGGGGLSSDREIFRHEVTHQILVQGWGLDADPTVRPHFWAMEGVGAYAQGFRPAQGPGPGRFAGRAHPWFAEAARDAERDRHVPLPEFLAMDAGAFMGRNALAHYQQAYALTVFLAERCPGCWIRYLREVHVGAASDLSLERHVGIRAAELEREWLAWLR